jgi:hypothetical protein
MHSPINKISLTGTVNSTQTIISPVYGHCLDFELFTEDWWEDRHEHPHMFKVPVRLLNPPVGDIEGSTLLVEGRLKRWSVGTTSDGRPPRTGILADRVTVLDSASARPKVRRKRAHTRT